MDYRLMTDEELEELDAAGDPEALRELERRMADRNEDRGSVPEDGYDASEEAGGAPEADPIDKYPRLKTFPLYSCLDILLLSGVGLILFRKKEIR